jgi:hypothetical protein
MNSAINNVAKKRRQEATLESGNANADEPEPNPSFATERGFC